MHKSFVLVSGLPGSGKSTLARRLAPALNLTLIDKDDILERLFALHGVGDAAWRRRLSRESDEILQRDATLSNGAVLASFWRLPGMPADSGTPTDWIMALPARVVGVHCACAPEIAADRFLHRKRHPGHLDRDASFDVVLASLRELAGLGPVDMPHRVDVDTSQEPDLESVVHDVRDALERGITMREA